MRRDEELRLEECLIILENKKPINLEFNILIRPVIKELHSLIYFSQKERAEESLEILEWYEEEMGKLESKYRDINDKVRDAIDVLEDYEDANP